MAPAPPTGGTANSHQYPEPLVLRSAQGQGLFVFLPSGCKRERSDFALTRQSAYFRFLK
jgi:hypothetical protein